MFDIIVFRVEVFWPFHKKISMACIQDSINVYISSKAVILHRGWFWSPGTSGNVWRQFWLSQLRGRGVGNCYLMNRGQGWYYTSYNARTGLPQQALSSPHVSSAGLTYIFSRKLPEALKVGGENGELFSRTPVCLWTLMPPLHLGTTVFSTPHHLYILRPEQPGPQSGRECSSTI